jgi:hypothetical protein
MIHSAISVKSWQERTPSVEAARPARCPCCAAAGSPVGERCQLHGHGLRERVVQGPLAPGERSTTVTILARRFRCVVCHAVLLVVPAGVLRLRRYTAMAIGYAFALFGLLGQSPVAVRQAVSAWPVVGATAAAGWATLKRWTRAARAGTLFAGRSRDPPRTPLRSVAEAVAAWLSALVPPPCSSVPSPMLAFAGGAHVR